VGDRIHPITSAERDHHQDRSGRFGDRDRSGRRAARQGEIARRFPDHRVIGEEFGADAGDGPTWYVDPVDARPTTSRGAVRVVQSRP